MFSSKLETIYIPIYIPSESIRKTLIYWCLHGIEKETGGMIWFSVDLKIVSKVIPTGLQKSLSFLISSYQTT